MVSIGSSRPQGDGTEVTDRFAAREGNLPPGGAFDAPDVLAAKAESENFPVASLLLPAGLRADLMAIYGFARLTDDIGDEVKGDRLALLDWLEADLDRAAAGKATHRVLQQLTPVIAKSSTGLNPFKCLIEANRMDQRVTRYESFDDLVAYCMLSAAPVGWLVLDVFGVSSPQRVALSDKVCIGLQLVEHLQDVREDAERGRIYLPGQDMTRFGCAESDLLAPSAPECLRNVIDVELARARELFAAGVPLAASLGFRPRVAVMAFAAGGMAVVDSIERADRDVLAVSCRPSKTRLAMHVVGGLARCVTERRAA